MDPELQIIGESSGIKDMPILNIDDKESLNKPSSEFLQKGCMVPKCHNAGIFKCPEDGPLRRKWRKVIRNADLKYGLQWKGTDDDYICESHFTSNDIIEEVNPVTDKVEKKLKRDAIPSVFVRTATVETTEKIYREISKLAIGNQEEFLENWTPESSNRETRKLTRKVYNQG
ncbi:hypothetical protein CHUAL_001498 [Chamberlinius hualienensis]